MACSHPQRLLAGIVAVAALTGCQSGSGGHAVMRGSASKQSNSPATDPFYRAPATVAHLRHGAVIRSRPAAVTANGIGRVATARTVVFASRSVRGAPIAASATVFTPRSPYAGGGPRPILSFQQAYDSLGVQCDPSYLMQVDPSRPFLLITGIKAMLAKGWEVVVPDYEGPRALFVIGPQQGRIVLDGIRAAEALRGQQRPASIPASMYGYSGGALASAWAAELASTYTPDLDVVGAAYGGVPANIGGLVRSVVGTTPAGLGVLMLVALDRAYPAAHIAAALNQRGRHAFAKVAHVCVDDPVVASLSGIHLGELMRSPGFLDRPRVRRVLDRVKLGHAAPRVPVYVYQARHDGVVPFGAVRHLLGSYCRRGTSVDSVIYPHGDHSTTAGKGAPKAIAWIGQRFAGRPSPNRCRS